MGIWRLIILRVYNAFPPIRLCNILSPSSAPQASYNLICPTTEKYLTPSSILWTTPGTHFLTGTECLISHFDISYPGSGPITKLPTIPSKRHKMKGGGVGMRGIVSALSLQSSPDGNSGSSMLAAGTWTRWVGLYDAAGLGGTVGTWDISAAADAEADWGQGISELGWSACGRYLWVVERKSRGVLVYDVRVTGKLVSWLEGREAETNQRLGVSCFEGEKGMEIWAGGTDGVVRVWEGVGGTEGGVGCDWEWKAHNDPIGSTVLHPSGTVVATCSGQRAETNINDDDTSTDSEEDSSDDESASDSQQSPSMIRKTKGRTPDNSLKVWSL
ncbi:4b9964d5-f52e-4aa1-8318-58c179e78714 [Sclerotinia trifoliorum]|uniref:4b9964d5-f52e-4aa1-8318-58c179e78714 n=1 Tax=Sclerotinia trifoliorum TaxID=28548 RepID=A0A8H2VX53_9HELO|nr:4b9964d5-f52e-4aa1-8318-58c179e78714 [Sclerotinia trifoliorum]